MKHSRSNPKVLRRNRAYPAREGGKINGKDDPLGRIEGNFDRKRRQKTEKALSFTWAANHREFQASVRASSQNCGERHHQRTKPENKCNWGTGAREKPRRTTLRSRSVKKNSVQMKVQDEM